MEPEEDDLGALSRQESVFAQVEPLGPSPYGSAKEAGPVQARVFSVGHSNHPLPRFIDLLQSRGIEVLVDTRSYPFSIHAPQFNRSTLEEELTRGGIQYLYLGKQLGGRPEGDEYYDADGRVLYWRVAASQTFLLGLRRVERWAGRSRLGVMCSEENPTECHRRLLIGRVLRDRDIGMDHVRGDGRVQPEEELADELKKRGVGQIKLGERAEDAWKSTRSVSRRRMPASSSEP